MSERFHRTTCDCESCRACCRRQPGSLAPGDFERIAEHLHETPAVAAAHFWASGGALVMDTATGRQFRIGSITPRLDRRGKRCVFLDGEERCRIHAVAPCGCAYFDTHMNREASLVRSTWLATAQRDENYQALRRTLPFADSYKPSAV